MAKRKATDGTQPECWRLLDALAETSTRAMLLYGPPATGKSYYGRTLARDGQAVHCATVHDDMAAQELVGHWIVGQDGAFTWRDGIAITSWRTGGVLVLDEVQGASPAVVTILHALLDSPETARLDLPTGETVRPRDGWRCVVTTNATPDILPIGVQSRLAVRVHVDAPHPDALAALPPELRNIARDTCTDPDPDRVVTLRQWYAVAELQRERLDLSDALHAVLGNEHRAASLADAIAIAATAEGED